MVRALLDLICHDFDGVLFIFPPSLPFLFAANIPEALLNHNPPKLVCNRFPPPSFPPICWHGCIRQTHDPHPPHSTQPLLPPPPDPPTLAFFFPPIRCWFRPSTLWSVSLKCHLAMCVGDPPLTAIKQLQAVGWGGGGVMVVVVGGVRDRPRCGPLSPELEDGCLVSPSSSQRLGRCLTRHHL